MLLTYFAVRGRVDTIRLVLELVGAPYTFEGITVEAWRQGDAKARALGESPFGQLPVFRDGDLVLCQSQAILRHVARTYDLAGTTPKERAHVDEICETAFEMIVQMATLFWDPAFHEKRADHRQATAKKLSGLRDHFLRRSPDGTHWATNATSGADAAMAFALETMLLLHPGLVEATAELDRAMRGFFALEPVRRYVTSDRRPKSWTVPHAVFGGKPDETHQF